MFIMGKDAGLTLVPVFVPKRYSKAMDIDSIQSPCNGPKPIMDANDKGNDNDNILFYIHKFIKTMT